MGLFVCTIQRCSIDNESQSVRVRVYKHEPFHKPIRTWFHFSNQDNRVCLDYFTINQETVFSKTEKEKNGQPAGYPIDCRNH